MTDTSRTSSPGDPMGDGADDLADTTLPEREDQPETQGGDPLELELGDDGQGDLAPEDH